jgi:hypothetical protein
MGWPRNADERFAHDFERFARARFRSLMHVAARAAG